MKYQILLNLSLLLVIVACSSTPTSAPATPTSISPAATPTTVPTPNVAASPTATRVATITTTSAPPTSAAAPLTPTPLPVTPTTPTTATPSTTRSWNFDGDAVSALPAGMVIFSGAWAVRAEADAPSAPHALCQTGTATFPALSLGAASYADVVVTARFKPLTGQVDRAAGIIFRVKDKDNHYILRANALEDNVNLYTYISGRRTTIKEGNVKVPSGQWQELRAEAVGNRLRGYLNGQLVVETTNSQFTVGGVGLWTKEDSVTCFDNVVVNTP